MFLAIINDTYAEVKSDIAQQKSEFEIGDYFKKVLKSLVLLNLRKKAKRDFIQSVFLLLQESTRKLAVIISIQNSGLI